MGLGELTPTARTAPCMCCLWGIREGRLQGAAEAFSLRPGKLPDMESVIPYVLTPMWLPRGLSLRSIPAKGIVMGPEFLPRGAGPTLPQSPWGLTQDREGQVWQRGKGAWISRVMQWGLSLQNTCLNHLELEQKSKRKVTCHLAIPGGL